MAEVLSNYAELRTYEAETARARGERAQAGAWRNPEVAVEAGHKEVREGDTRERGAVLGVQLAQTFEFPGKATLRKAVAEQNVLLAEWGVEQFRRELEVRTRVLAAEWRGATAVARIARGVMEDAAEVARTLEARPAAGSPRLIELRLAGAALVELRSAALNAQARADDLRASINLLRGQPPEAPLELLPPVLEAPRPVSPESELYSLAAQHPNVRLKALELERSRLEASSARLSRAPDFTIAPFYSREEAGDVEQMVGASVSLELPLWDHGRGETQAAEAGTLRAAAARPRGSAISDSELNPNPKENDR